LGLFAGENFGKQLLEIADPEGGDVDAGLVELDAAAKVMIDKLLWWTVALKAARASGHRPELSMSATRRERTMAAASDLRVSAFYNFDIQPAMARPISSGESS
jgi:hypothetical protein